MLSCLYPRRLHVCSGCCTGSLHALLVPVAGQTLRWPSHENCEQEGSDWPADRLPDHRVFFLYGWGCSASLLSLRTHTCRLGQRHNHTHAHSHTHKTHTDKGHILRDGGEMRRGSVCEVQRSSEEFTCILLKLFNPFFSPADIRLFVAGMSLTEGNTAAEGLEEFKEKFWEFYKAGRQ